MRFIFYVLIMLTLSTSAIAAGTAVSALPSASVVNDPDLFMIVQGGVNKKVTASNVLDSTVLLNKIKTVDGTGSGLDADFLDGLHSTAFATAAQGTKADLAQPSATAINTTNVYNYIQNITGAIMAFAMTSCPSGWIAADGLAKSRATYANLFAAIGAAIGPGDGVSTFDIPDLRGEFIRGIDSARGIDSGRILGSWQDSQNKAHTHTYYTLGGAGGLNGNGYSNNNWGWQITGNPYNTPEGGGAEARPRNVALLYCIKY